MQHFILFLFGLPVFILGNTMDKMKEMMQLCCDRGTEFAFINTEDCSSAKASFENLSIAPICNYISEQCCQEYNMKRTHCEKGIQLAKTSQLVMSHKENLVEVCFDQCKLGARVGKSNGIASCKTTFQRKSAEHILFGEAFSQCCKAAASDARNNPKKPAEIRIPFDTPPIIVSSTPSMCEEFPIHEHCAHHCIPVPGSYKCECNPGFILMPDGHSCEKVASNRCDLHNTCQHECIDNEEGIKCSCKKGYQLMADKISCEDINECALGIHNCEKNIDQNQCINILGSYHCVKHINSLPTPSLRIDSKVFHSTTSEIITATSIITASPQTASTYVTLEITTQLPTLLEKHTQPGVTSPSITNELSVHKTTETVKDYGSSQESLQKNPKVIKGGEALLNSEVTKVAEVPASPKLTVLNNDEKTVSDQELGYDSPKVNTGDVPKNEWSQINNTSADCQTGFEMNSLGLCIDIDECAEKTHLCDEYQNCFNTNGSYECHCKLGFELDATARVCVDVNECATGEALCGTLQVCTNLPGGYTCSCPAGHKLVGDHVCEDVDECALGGNIAACTQNADCINTVGSYQCRCHQGFKAAPVNDKVCVDVDECANSQPSTVCQHRCHNLWGGYRCSCHRGYRLNLGDNRTCADINECTEFKHNKNLCIGSCLNEPGSYSCSCPSGYRLSEDKRSCVDIDECQTGEAPCATDDQYEYSSIKCFNTRGSYHCLNITCPFGYKLENKNHCIKVKTYCQPGDRECFNQPSVYSYNHITFVSNLYISESKVNLFTMKGPAWAHVTMLFELHFVNVDAPPSVKEKADINAFLLTQKGHQAIVSLVKSLEGPQTIELELSMKMYSNEQVGRAVSKLFIFVSEYEF